MFMLRPDFLIASTIEKLDCKVFKAATASCELSVSDTLDGVTYRIRTAHLGMRMTDGSLLIGKNVLGLCWVAMADYWGHTVKVQIAQSHGGNLRKLWHNRLIN